MSKGVFLEGPRKMSGEKEQWTCPCIRDFKKGRPIVIFDKATPEPELRCIPTGDFDRSGRISMLNPVNCLSQREAGLCDLNCS